MPECEGQFLVSDTLVSMHFAGIFLSEVSPLGLIVFLQVRLRLAGQTRGFPNTSRVGKYLMHVLL
jgi:hypothetical protein